MVFRLDGCSVSLAQVRMTVEEICDFQEKKSKTMIQVVSEDTETKSKKKTKGGRARAKGKDIPFSASTMDS